MSSPQAVRLLDFRPLAAIQPAERLMLSLILGFGLAAVACAFVLQRSVNWPPFLTGYFATLALAGVGAYIRQVKAARRIALAIIGVAIFMGFTAVSSVFIFTLFPLPNPLIDEALIHLDGVVGYYWPGFVAALAEAPTFAKALGYLYHTSLPQIVLTIIVLAALGRELTLHRFLMVGIVSMIITVSIWWLWPSVGPSAFLSIPEDVRLATGLYFDPEYGAYLRHLVEIGPRWVSPEVMTGVVAFPSYHMIMACMVVWFTWRTAFFLPALVVNALMIPATLSHGGHHLIDLVAGVAVFALSLWITGRLIRTPG